MGLPVEILNERKYERRSYEFNFGIIIKPEEYQDKTKRNIYEQMLRKMATYLTILEVDHEFLWLGERKKSLQNLVMKLYDKLVSVQSIHDISFCLPFDYQNSFMFQFQCKHDDPQQVRTFDVPIFINLEIYNKYDEIVELTSDILQQKIRPLIDGKRHIKQISEDSKIDIDIVIQCIKTMVFYGVVAVIDIFQYSNIYSATQNIIKLSQFTVEDNLCDKCQKYVYNRIQQEVANDLLLGNLVAQNQEELMIDDDEEDDDEQDFDMHFDGEQRKTLIDQIKRIKDKEIRITKDKTSKQAMQIQYEISRQKIIQLYSAITSGIRVKDVVVKYSDESINYMNIKYFIEFGLLNNLIQRKHKYAIHTNPFQSQLGQLLSMRSQQVIQTPKQANITNNNVGAFDNILRSLTHDYSNFTPYIFTQDLNTFSKIEQYMISNNWSFDQVCVEFKISQSELESKLKQKGYVTYYQ
eukprot:403374190